VVWCRPWRRQWRMDDWPAKHFDSCAGNHHNSFH
jgi:hypothetical protein